MSDDRPAITALNEALIRHGIPRDYVTMLNHIKLDILFPEEAYEQCTGANREETGNNKEGGSSDPKVDETGDRES